MLLIDLQERLLAKIARRQALLSAVGKMVRVAQVLAIPIVVTEQYPAGLGRTDRSIRSLLPQLEPIVKMDFSCCGQDGFLQALAGPSRQQVIIVGIEAHVCVQQTALDLLTAGYEVFVCADAVGSRNEFDYDVALLRLQQAGVVVTTTEAVIFELLERAGTEEFRRVLQIVK